MLTVKVKCHTASSSDRVLSGSSRCNGVSNQARKPSPVHFRKVPPRSFNDHHSEPMKAREECLKLSSSCVVVKAFRRVCKVADPNQASGSVKREIVLLHIFQSAATTTIRRANLSSRVQLENTSLNQCLGSFRAVGEHRSAYGQSAVSLDGHQQPLHLPSLTNRAAHRRQELRRRTVLQPCVVSDTTYGNTVPKTKRAISKRQGPVFSN